MLRIADISRATLLRFLPSVTCATVGLTALFVRGMPALLKGDPYAFGAPSIEADPTARRV